MARWWLQLLLGGALMSGACSSQGPGELDTYADGGSGSDGDSGVQGEVAGQWVPLDGTPLFNRVLIDSVAYDGGTLVAGTNPIDSNALHVAFFDAAGQVTEHSFEAIPKNTSGVGFAVASDGTPFLVVGQFLGETGMHLYTLDGTVWREQPSAYLSELDYQWVSLSSDGDSIALGALALGNLPRVFALDRSTVTWVDTGSEVLGGAVNRVEVAEDSDGLFAIVQNAGGESSGFWRRMGANWTQLAEDVTGTVGDIDIESSPVGAYLLARRPHDRLYQSSSNGIDLLYEASEGERLLGLTVPPDGSVASMCRFENNGFQGLLEIDSDGSVTRYSKDSDGSLQVPALISSPVVHVGLAGQERRLFYSGMDNAMYAFRFVEE